MRVLVTGGAGFIGSHLTEALLERGDEILVIDDFSTGHARNIPVGVHAEKGDIRDDAFVARLFEIFRPEVVTHQAAQTSVPVSVREPLRDAQINVLGSLNLLEASVRTRVARFVFASSGGGIYGDVPDGERANLDSPPRPASPYACSKLAVEAYLAAYRQEHGLESCSLRYSNVYGPRQDPHGEAGVVAIFSERLLRGERIRIHARREEGDEGCERDYVYVGDVVAANVLAISSARTPRIVNVCTGKATSTLELAKLIARAARCELDVEHGPRRAGDVERSVLEPPDGVSSVSLAQGLEKTVAAFRTRLL